MPYEFCLFSVKVGAGAFLNVLATANGKRLSEPSFGNQDFEVNRFSKENYSVGLNWGLIGIVFLERKFASVFTMGASISYSKFMNDVNLGNELELRPSIMNSSIYLRCAF